MSSGSLCLVDAMVLVDAAKYGFLEPLLAGHTIGVATGARREVRFYRDGAVRHVIDLAPYIADGRLLELSASHLEVDVVVDSLQRRLGAGEVESLALVVGRECRFCTADKAAVRSMGRLGILDRWVPLEDLLSSLDPPLPVPDLKYCRAAADPT